MKSDAGSVCDAMSNRPLLIPHLDTSPAQVGTFVFSGLFRERGVAPVDTVQAHADNVES